MCGITGFAGKGNMEDIISMTNILNHRGPDEQGIYQDPELPVYFGHKRLSIIDISDGKQPMSSKSNSIVVVYNGEIYNHLELRKKLQMKGHHFCTDHSDTEVLIHGYEEWGERLPEKLNGMFAFAILDRKRNEIFMARDRFGEKPLYYSLQNSLFVFASELTPLILHSSLVISPDKLSVQKYFAYGYIPAPYSLYSGVNKLPGGYSLRYNLNNNKLSLQQYWKFEINVDDSFYVCREDLLVEQLREILLSAVQRRLISDVPLGIFLSGGLDSGALLAMISQCMDASSIKSFCIGFNEPSYDESKYAAQIAGKYGVTHSDKILNLNYAKELIPALTRKLDEPIGDASIIPTYLLCEFAKEHITVALTGDGGDELFAGYDPFRALLPARLYSYLIPRKFHKGLRSLIELLPYSDNNMSFDFKLRRTLSGLSYEKKLWNPVWLAPLEPCFFSEVFEGPLSAEELYEDVITQWDKSKANNLVDKTLEFYTNFYLKNNILTKVDRASMMTSLETRAVFLDNDVVNFCQKLPSKFKYRNGERKYLLKRAMEGMIPHDLLNRKKKGFGIPLSAWLRELQFDHVEEQLALIGNTDWLMRQWTKHKNKETEQRLLLWAFYCINEVLGRHRILTC